MVKRSKEEVINGQLHKVVRRVQREQKKHPKHKGITNCLRYIHNRPGQFKYAEAIKRELPVGSGLIESTNRSLIQQRLKVPGGWWLPKNADAMAQLRTLRANGDWEKLWQCAV